MNIDLMSEIAEIVDTLEKRLGKVLSKLDDLEKTNLNLRAELNKTATVVIAQNKDFEALKMQYDTLKIANSLLGSEENKRDTKLKINSLIREIDYCIAQLSD
jgi:chromosome segregation ATPase